MMVSFKFVFFVFVVKNGLNIWFRILLGMFGLLLFNLIIKVDCFLRIVDLVEIMILFGFG